MDVGDAIAFRVAAAGFWIEGDVSSKTIGDAQPRAFAYQHYAESCAKSLADRVPESDTRLMRQDDRTECEIL